MMELSSAGETRMVEVSRLHRPAGNIEYVEKSEFCAWAPFYIALNPKVTSVYANRIWGGTLI